MKNIFETSFTMDNITKLAFSGLEAQLVQNSEWILTKQSALQKVEQLLAAQVPVIKEAVPSSLQTDPALMAGKPKISRGEKYRGLPWIMLDFPALFGKENIFALRTMFWWGNFFSVTLHLSGTYHKELGPIILPALRRSGIPFFCSIGKYEWEHHFEEDNFLPAGKIPGDESLLSQHFLKVALYFPLSEWDSIDDHLAKAYKNIFALIA